MVSYPNTDKHPEVKITLRGELRSDDGSDVLLHYFIGVMEGLDETATQKMRDELMNRFGGRYCSTELCSKMIELLNGRLAELQQLNGQYRGH